MYKTMNKKTLLALLCCSALALTACNDDDQDQKTSVDQVTEPTLISFAKQSSIFPIPSSPLRIHNISTTTANASGYAWFKLAPSLNANIMSIYRDATASPIVFGAETAAVTSPFVDASHRAYKAHYRVVSAALTLWLTAPYLSSTGIFISGTVPHPEITEATMLDNIGDSRDC